MDCLILFKRNNNDIIYIKNITFFNFFIFYRYNLIIYNFIVIIDKIKINLL